MNIPFFCENIPSERVCSGRSFPGRHLVTLNLTDDPKMSDQFKAYVYVIELWDAEAEIGKLNE